MDFQPTYEGLKHEGKYWVNIVYNYFQPTYEGLKHKKRKWNKANIWYFQPTYEGLKHIDIDLINLAKKIFSLPMRDWNIWNINLFSSKFSKIFSLPMRDWNQIILQKQIKVFGMKFSAYLWGIETFQLKHN